MTDTSNLPRGIRLNNPGNIRKSKDKWQGLAVRQPDESFAAFTAPQWGIRAMARILIGYQDNNNINTIDGIVNRWAPVTENNTLAYRESVAKQSGIAPFTHLNLHTYEHLMPIIKAMIKHENGVQPYGQDVIDKGLALAGVIPPKKPLAQSTTIKGAQVSAVGTFSTIATSLAEPLTQAQQALEPLSDLIEWVKYISLALTLIGIGITIYARVRDDHVRIT